LRVTQDIEPDVEPFIDLLVEIRQELREAQQWELADQVRDRLADLDIILEDRKEDTIWHFRKE
jgi:cysteinyl-tRNA synthetase